MRIRRATRSTSTLVAMAALAVLSACGKPASPDGAAGDARTAEIDAREQAVAQREAELAQQAAQKQADELAAREADLAKQQEELTAQQEALAKQQAAAKAAATKAAAKPATKPATSTASTKPAVPAVPKVVRVNVPAGTSIPLQLGSAITTKSAKVGDSFDTIVTQDIVVDGKNAIPAGSRVRGTVSQVYSGSKNIGGQPSITLQFNQLLLADGQVVPISGQLKQAGRSDKGMDAAKIGGGALAGAVLGHQVDGGGAGKIIGGLIGAGAGAAAAKNTGAEVELAQDTPLTIQLGGPVEVTVK